MLALMYFNKYGTACHTAHMKYKMHCVHVFCLLTKLFFLIKRYMWDITRERVFYV